MTQQHTGYLIFVAAIGLMATMMAQDIQELGSWWDATTPNFIGTIIGHFGAVVGAFVGGKLLPTPER